MPWLVVVDLAAAAKRLSRLRTHHCDELDVLAYFQSLPVVQTQQLGLYYTHIDPTLIFDPGDVKRVLKSWPALQPQRIEGIPGE